MFFGIFFAPRFLAWEAKFTIFSIWGTKERRIEGISPICGPREAVTKNFFDTPKTFPD